MRNILLFLTVALLWGRPSAFSQRDTVLIDFGDVLSPAPWNNVTDFVAGRIDNLLTSAGTPSGKTIQVYDAFSNIVTQGTLIPDPSLGFPPTATGDSFFGYSVAFGGQVQPTGGVELSGLDRDKAHTFTIFASRVSSPNNQEAQYTFLGATTVTVFLDAANNTDRVATATLFPDANGLIHIEASQGPNNNTALGLYYLGALSLSYEQDPPPTVPTDTILIDFGSVLSPAPWNNVTNPAAGFIADLQNSAGQPTGKSILVFDPFNNINTVGTQNPDPAIDFPPTATGDSFFGNTVIFGGQVQITGGVELGNLTSGKPYTITIFASRISVTDNREAQYFVEGLTTETVFLDASNNTDRIVSATVVPDADGIIRIATAPGPNNNNSTGFYYLGALKVIYERGETGPAELSLVSPNDGEYWQVGKTPSIIWESKNLGNVVLEYSTDAGNSWATIDVVPAIRKEYPWTVPNTPSANCMVRISADTLSVRSESVFEIADDAVTCRIVVLGSSTAEGTGASPADSSWVNHYRKAIFQKNTRYAVTNLARGGYTTYHILPTGTPIPPGVNVSIDQARNITQALALEPYAVIVNMPSNDAANFFPVEAQLANIALIAQTTNAANAGVWVATSQPRNFSNPGQIVIQTQFRDFIIAIYGDNAIDFWTGIAAPNGFIAGAYDSGDGIHLNNAGHRLLFERVLAKGIDTIDCTTFTSIPEIAAPGGLEVKVFPNPFRDTFTVEFETESGGQVEFKIMDVLGRQVDLVRKIVPGGGIHQLQVQLPTGRAAGQQILFGVIQIQDTRGMACGAVRLVRSVH